MNRICPGFLRADVASHAAKPEEEPHFRFYRLLTVAAVGSMVFAWAFAQTPYLLPGELTISQAIAPFATQVLLLVVTACLLLVIAPALGLLIYLDQRTKLVE